MALRHLECHRGAVSSVGQSTSFTPRGSGVRVPYRPLAFFFLANGAVAPAAGETPASAGEVVITPSIIWPTTLYQASWSDHVIEAPAIIAHVYELKAQRRAPVTTESWFHITNDGGYHDAHVHNKCSWCGIYYLQAGECTPTDESGPGNGINRLYSPLPSGGAYIDYGNQYRTMNQADIVPRDGLLLLFPSYLLHSALAYRGQRDRIAISFNSQTTLDA